MKRRPAPKTRTPSPVQIATAVAEHVAGLDRSQADLVAAIEVLAEQRRRVEADLRGAVDVARVSRLSWAAIGAAIGTTGQAAQQRYGR